MSGPAKTTVVGRFMRQIWKDRVSYLFLLPFALSFIPVSYTHLTLPTNREV